MPPFKPLGLQIITEQEVLQPAAAAAAARPAGCLSREEEDWEVKPDGRVSMLGKSMKGHYVFGQEGLIKAAGMDAPHYKVSQSDIMFIKQLGAGACATVDKGYHRQQRKFVAVKRVNATNKELRQQMLRDIKILSDAQEVPGLLMFLGAYLDQQREQMAIVLEYMDGGTLADVLAKLGRLPEDMLAVITAKVLRGLAFLHAKRMVHRDIKPANILLNLAGEAKLSDFGISATVENTLAQCNTYAGTVTYMSPERLENKPYNFTCDIWSLGLVLVECLTGRYPYAAAVGGGPLDIILHLLQDEPPLPPPGCVSDLCRDFLSQCLSKDPVRRPPASLLLGHPWLSQAGPVNLRGVLRGAMFSADDKLDEIAFHFSFTYYSMLSQAAAAAAAAAAGGGGAGGGVAAAEAGVRGTNGGGAAAAASACVHLAPLYLDNSLLTHGAVLCRGRGAIMGQLQRLLEGYAGFGGATWLLRTVDSQDMLRADCQQTGCLMVTVTGQIQLGPACAAAGAAAGAAAAGAGVATAAFCETFILGQTAAREYYVANQMFRLLG